MNKLIEKKVNQLNKILRNLPTGALTELINLINIEIERRNNKWKN